MPNPAVGCVAPKVAEGVPNKPLEGWLVAVAELPNIDVLDPKPVGWKVGAAVPVGFAPNDDWPNPVDVLVPKLPVT